MFTISLYRSLNINFRRRCLRDDAKTLDHLVAIGIDFCEQNLHEMNSSQLIIHFCNLCKT